MRLVGIEFESRPWIAAEIDGGYAPIAEVDAFYDDVYGYLESFKPSEAQVVSGNALVVPVPVRSKVLCAGLNYSLHAAEANRELPKAPDVFARWYTTLVPGGVSVPLPTNEPGLDWEGELAVVIGRPLKDATPEEVEAAVLGYTILNDLSARQHQRAAVQWCIGKNADKSAPFGPAIVTRDEIPDPYNLKLETRVEGETMQSANTGEMLFKIGQIGAFASETMTLMPGDVIATGTPAGIGAKRQPPQFLQAGQTVEVEIEGIGILSTPIG